MRNQRLTPYYVGFGVLIVLVLAILALNTFRATPQITLPDPPGTSEQGGSNDQTDGGAYTRLSVTPETVQGVIATLARPKIMPKMQPKNSPSSARSNVCPIAVIKSGP